jgi:hypothetical protein
VPHAGYVERVDAKGERFRCQAVRLFMGLPLSAWRRPLSCLVSIRPMKMMETTCVVAHVQLLAWHLLTSAGTIRTSREQSQKVTETGKSTPDLRFSCVKPLQRLAQHDERKVKREVVT